MFHLVAQQYYCTTPPIMAIPSVVEIVMAPEGAMCKTKCNGAETHAAIEKLERLIAAEAANAGDCGFPGAHVVIPTPDQAECQNYRG